MVWRTDKGAAAFRSKMLSVPCQDLEAQGQIFRGCGAEVGKPCLYADSKKGQRGFHSAREFRALTEASQ